MGKIKTIALAGALGMTILLSGCGSVSSQNVIAESVSGYKFNKMSCSDLEFEMDYLQRAARTAAGVVDTVKATQDGKDAIAFLFFWPALFLTDDNKPQAAELARLKGEFEAANRIYSRKCVEQ